MREVMLVLHFVGLAMGVGNGFAHMFMGMSLKNMSEEEANKLVLKTMVINKMGYIGLFLLVLSGGYLMTPYWDTLMENHSLLAKLVCVLLLIVMVVTMNGLAKKAKKQGGGESLEKIKKMGMVTLPLGIVIIILAVLTFH